MSNPFESVQGDGVAEEAIRQHKERLAANELAANEAAERAKQQVSPDPEATDVVELLPDESAPQA